MFFNTRWIFCASFVVVLGCAASSYYYYFYPLLSYLLWYYYLFFVSLLLTYLTLETHDDDLGYFSGFKYDVLLLPQTSGFGISTRVLRVKIINERAEPFGRKCYDQFHFDIMPS